jgi:predicted enzyme related to lactoylglutathione lyase
MAAKKTKKRAPQAKGRVAKKTAKKSAKKPAKKASKRTAKRVTAKKTARGRLPEIVHWEVQSQDPAGLQRFYADVFGWKIDANNPMHYGMVSSGGRDGIDGGIGGTQGPGSRVVVYARVPGIGPILDKIESLGGRTIMPRTDIGPVIMAIYTDPEGNTMGLIEG